MDNSWIKLYRKILNNDELFRSRNTFPVLCWLLLLVDRKTGKATIGRFMGSKWLKIKPSSFYLALRKLESMKIIQQQSNNKMTTVTITKWFIYQSKQCDDKTDPNNKLTTNEQQNNTIQEYKKRDIPPISPKGEFVTFLNAFNSLFTKEYRETPGRLRAYTQRRKTYSAPQILTALQNMSQDPFSKGEGQRGWIADPDYFLRSDEIVDKWLNKAPIIQKGNFIPYEQIRHLVIEKKI